MFLQKRVSFPCFQLFCGVFRFWIRECRIWDFPVSSFRLFTQTLERFLFKTRDVWFYATISVRHLNFQTPALSSKLTNFRSQFASDSLSETLEYTERENLCQAGLDCSGFCGDLNSENESFSPSTIFVSVESLGYVHSSFNSRDLSKLILH